MNLIDEKIQIKNIRYYIPREKDVLVSRDSIFGNPFTHLDLKKTNATIQVESREKAIFEYEKWIRKIIEFPTTDFEFKIIEELNSLLDRLISGETINLCCYCFPKPCHAEIIKKLLIEKYFKKERF